MMLCTCNMTFVYLQYCLDPSWAMSHSQERATGLTGSSQCATLMILLLGVDLGCMIPGGGLVAGVLRAFGVAWQYKISCKTTN